MGDAGMGRDETTPYSEDDVVGILQRQHVRIRELFAEVRREQGEQKQQVFDALRALLAVHETAEEMIVRPASRSAAGAGVVDARNREEKEANQMLLELERADVSSPGFDARFADLEKSVLAHAEREEADEFPALRRTRSQEQLRNMGRRLRTAERLAPTHPHPSTAGSPAAQWVVGPFVSIVDHVRDAMKV